MGYEVRNIRRDEWPLLEDFLYEAIYVPEGNSLLRGKNKAGVAPYLRW